MEYSYNEGDLVWIRDDEHVWLEGVCSEVNQLSYEIRTDFGVKELSQKDLNNMVMMRSYDEKMGKVDQLSSLRDLGEPSLFESIRRRYMAQNIHSLIAQVLVVINPYESLPIYRQIDFDTAEKRKGKFAHVFGIAAEALDAMRTGQGNQTVTVSGESGAGKTETAKKLLQYIMEKNKHASQSKPVLDSNIILESLGNAKTLRNNNSSRFGKFIKITFNADNCVSGAQLETYMLEKSRVVTVSTDERNYHIFYQMLAGLTEEKKLELALEETDPSAYHYLSQSGCYDIPGVDDGEIYFEFISALRGFGMDDTAIEGFESVLGSILHIGNVQYRQMRNSDNASFYQSDITLAYVAGLLGVEGKSLKQGLIKRKMTVVGETIMVEFYPNPNPNPNPNPD